MVFCDWSVSKKRKIASRDISDYFESKELTKGKGYEAILLWVSSRGSQRG